MKVKSIRIKRKIEKYIIKEAKNASFYFAVISLLHKKEHVFIIQIQEQNVLDRKEAA